MKYAIYWSDGVKIGTPRDVLAFFSVSDRAYYIATFGDNFPGHQQHFQAVTKAEAETLMGKKAVANSRAKFIADNEKIIKKMFGG